MVLPVFLLIILAMFDVGRLIYTQNTIGNAAREAARIAIVNQDVDAIRDHALGSMIALDPSATQIDVTYSGAQCSPAMKIGCGVTVAISQPWGAITPLVGDLIGDMTLVASTTMPVERVFSQAPPP